MSDKKGFSGFDSLMDLGPDEVLQNIPQQLEVEKEDNENKKSAIRKKKKTEGTGSKTKAFWWIAGIVFVIWLIAQQDSGTSSTSSYSSGYNSPSYQSNSDSYAETESKPPVGQNNIFDRSQIRYCLSQDVRMTTIQGGIDNYSDYEVSMYNALVNDYNSRCSSFRYSSGTLESVRLQVEEKRTVLVAEGYAILQSWRGQQ